MWSVSSLSEEHLPTFSLPLDFTSTSSTYLSPVAFCSVPSLRPLLSPSQLRPLRQAQVHLDQLCDLRFACIAHSCNTLQLKLLMITLWLLESLP